MPVRAETLFLVTLSFPNNVWVHYLIFLLSMYIDNTVPLVDMMDDIRSFRGIITVTLEDSVLTPTAAQLLSILSLTFLLHVTLVCGIH